MPDPDSPLPDRPRLYSFELCPFVQRSVIVLREKGADFETIFVDLSNKPAWFLRLSPLGKVPVLEIGDTVLFESAIINEYLDETIPPPLHPSSPLKRAYNRAWVEFASELLFDQYRMATAPDSQAFAQARAATRTKLERLERELGDGPYFNGARFSLVDAAYAPALVRLRTVASHFNTDLIKDLPRITDWLEHLRAHAAVTASCPKAFETKLVQMILDKSGYITRLSATHGRP